MSVRARAHARLRFIPAALGVCLIGPSLADPPASVTYTYDELGRLRTGQYSDGRKVDYQYDPAGNRTTMTSGMPVQLTVGAVSWVRPAPPSQIGTERFRRIGRLPLRDHSDICRPR